MLNYIPMENTNTTGSVISHIKELIKKEGSVFNKDLVSESETEELQHLKSEIDKYWDILRQLHVLQWVRENPGHAG